MFKHEVTVQEVGRQVCITIYYRYRWIVASVYMAISLCFIIYEGHSSSSEIDQTTTYVFLGLVGIAFTLIALQVFFNLSPEIVTIIDNKMRVEHKVGPIIGRREVYELSKISNLHCAPVTERRKNSIKHLRKIIFDYNGKEVWLGYDLSESGADILLSNLKFMNNKSPDFFLGSSEHRGEWANGRACWIMGHFSMEDGTPCVLVHIVPSVIGQSYGLGGEDITKLLLAARYKDPIFLKKLDSKKLVLIYRILDDGAISQERVNNSDIELAAWGEIYTTLEEAKNAAVHR